MPQPAKKVDAGIAMKLKLRGMSYQTIGKQLGASKQAVQQAIAPILKKIPGANELAEYKQHSADVFQLTAQRMLLSIDDDDIKRISADKRVLAAAVATDKARLISNQSTSNLSIVLRAISDVESDDLPDNL